MRRLAGALFAFAVTACNVGDASLPAPPTVGTESLATADELQLTNEWAVYSPSTIWQGGQFVLYYGGWGAEQLAAFNQGTFPCDAIYRSVCSDTASCPNGQRVIHASMWGFVDAQGNTISELNDPSIIEMPGGYYIMYMTGLDLPWTPNAPIANDQPQNNHIYFATSWDGVTWSQPSRLLDDQWLPSATIAPSSEVYVYSTSNVNGLSYVTDMGASGVGPQWQAVMSTTDAAGNPRTYMNLHVQWVESIHAYQMVAQRPDLNDDYLYSFDGIHFIEQFAGIVESNAGHPAALPQDFCQIYHGNNGNVFVDSWCSRFF